MRTLSDKLAAAARAAVDRLFTRAKIRVGVIAEPTHDKRLVVSTDPRMTLPGLFVAAALEHGMTARPGATNEVRRSAAGFLGAQEEAVKAAVGRTVHHLMQQAEGVWSDEVKERLEEQLDRILERAGEGVERIVETEATAARNLSGIEAFSAMNAAAGVDDPWVFWVVTHRATCKECYRLHTIDGVTPRLWRLSEVSHSYHVRGDDAPSTFGLHPRCECTMTTLLPGWGFDSSGRVKYLGPGYSEGDRQRG